MNFVDYPWPHLVIDDYLPQDQFDSLRHEALRYGEDGDVSRIFFDHDPIPHTADLLNEFVSHRPVGDKGKLIHYAVTKKDFVHEKHCDAEFKIMSAVLYLGPEKNSGTRLYGRKGERVDVEWKPNRMFVFCGLTDFTWHDYTSTDTRYTLNYFLIDRSKVKNPEYKDKMIV